MNKFIVGEKVRIAIQPNAIFEITKVNNDNSYEVQYKLSEQHCLRYGNIASEMLQRVENTK